MRFLFLFFVLVLIITGCTSKPATTEPSVDADVSSIGSAIDDVDSMDSDLDMSELDGLEQDLDSFG
jgi:uncharacterized protein YceK